MIRDYKDGQYIKSPIFATPIPHIGEYGLGNELYFHMIKNLSLLFMLISIVSLWPIAENAYGGYLSENDKK